MGNADVVTVCNGRVWITRTSTPAIVFRTDLLGGHDTAHLYPKHARELAQVLNRYADEIDPNRKDK